MLYVDESGVPELDRGQLFVIGGVIIDESQWKKMNNIITTVKIEFFPNKSPEEIEFHGYEIRKGRSVFSGLSLEKRFELIENFFQKLNDSEFTIIEVVINKEKLLAQNKNYNPIRIGWEMLIERFDRFLKKIPDEKKSGLIIIDSKSMNQDSEFLRFCKTVRLDGTRYRDIDYVLEDPFFSKSTMRNLLQLADMVSYTTFRATLGKDEFFINIFNKYIKPKMDKSSSGIINGYGLKIFPK
ncbi:MAG: DUF3800 domain-containing protein [Candidatus Wukongarchaeota archaeon]|nr:DUF3800 domain-containing protein [Candidatus Wukongarchaeota archaeon]